VTQNQAWSEAGYAHSAVLNRCEDRVERLRLLCSAPLFSLWGDCRREMEDAASELERMAREIEILKARIRSLEGEDA